MFGLGTPTGAPSYVARGELGRVSRLRTRNGTWAVKELELFLPTPDEADMNVDLQESMLAAGVSLPRPRRTTDGHALFGNIRVYEWLDMTAIDVTDVGADEHVAAALAGIHLHTPAASGPPDPWYCHAPSRDEWASLTASAPDAWWAPMITGLAAELTDVPLPEHLPARLCHLDVCPENVFRCAGRLVIIDWENAGPAATVQDLGSSLWDFCRGDIERTRTFVDDYQRCGGPIERLDAAVFDTARVVQANLIHFHARRTIDPAIGSDARDRAEHRLRASLERVLTRQRIDEIVGA